MPSILYCPIDLPMKEVCFPMVKNWILSIILNLLFWLLALMLITVYDDYLAELVPVHFGRGGRPDAWEVRTSPLGDIIYFFYFLRYFFGTTATCVGAIEKA
ncbi:hypothetical protein ACQX19_10955 [Corynebacterium diphtheriae]